MRWIGENCGYFFIKVFDDFGGVLIGVKVKWIFVFEFKEVSE